jgi:hypothetical protein
MSQFEVIFAAVDPFESAGYVIGLVEGLTEGCPGAAYAPGAWAMSRGRKTLSRRDAEGAELRIARLPADPDFCGGGAG